MKQKINTHVKIGDKVKVIAGKVATGKGSDPHCLMTTRQNENQVWGTFFVS